MDGYVGLLDMAIVGVPAIVFGVWQLVSINREIARDRRKAVSPEGELSKGELPKGSGHAVGEHRLDDR